MFYDFSGLRLAKITNESFLSGYEYIVEKFVRIFGYIVVFVGVVFGFLVVGCLGNVDIIIQHKHGWYYLGYSLECFFENYGLFFPGFVFDQ